MEKRNQLLDVAKGVAILFVVLGHAIQQCSGIDSRDVLDSWIERYLISFHMPLFMLVSGYLFYFSLLCHSEKDIVNGRLKMFAWPILTIAIVHHLRGHITHFEVNTFLADFPMSLFNSLWFFWALLVITLLVCLVHRYGRDHWIGYVAIIGMTLLLPDAYPLRAYVHLLPTFIVAYMFAKYGVVKKIFMGWGFLLCTLMLTILVSVHLIMLRYFDYDTMIYFSRYSLLGSQDILGDFARDTFRFVIGIVGSIAVLLALYLTINSSLIRKKKILESLKYVGSITFGIYVFQDLMLLAMGPLSKHLNKNYYVLNSAVAFLVILTMSIVLTRLAGKNRWLSVLFLGKVIKRDS